MNFPFYIARRYLVSKKTHNIINIISGISLGGVMICTMALIIVMSVFGGFEKLVISLFNAFNPDILITVKEGKTFDSKLLPEDRIRKVPGVRYLTEVIEENALVRYKEKQYIATIKGVGEDYTKISGLDTMMSEGKFILQKGDQDFAVLGYGVAYYIGANLEDYANPVSIYVPRRNAGFTGGFENAFNNDVIFPSGFFSVQQDFDVKYVILPLRFVRKLLEYDREITGLEIGIAKGADVGQIQQQITRLAGNKFTVKNRFEQQALLYKIMKSEKWAIFLILTFILIIATFNVIGSLSMLILDKKRDIAVLQCLGASQKKVKRIFLAEGLLITSIGAITGLILGAVICFLQMKFGFVKLGSANSTFVVDAYPVHMQAFDFVIVFFTVMLISFLATWYPVYNIKKIETHILNQRF
ncbi:MAG: FtsX-like permease family protein [Bacteroidetes bacterium]|nr:FtsX-like permease family protein [Bacteroidota bacterium]